MWTNLDTVEGRTGHAQGLFSDAQLLGAIVDTSEDAIVGESLDPALDKCVTKALSRWTFPKPGDGEPVDVSYAFAFPPT